jgi:hypothetical protein
MKNTICLILAMFFVLASFSETKAQVWNSNAGGYNGGYGQVYQSFGMAQSTLIMQQTIDRQIQKSIMQAAMERKWGKEAVRKAQQNVNSGGRSTASNNQTSTPAKTTPAPKNYAKFTPTVQSSNLKIIAETLGSTEEEKTFLKQLFAETKKGFETEAAKKGIKNNVAAAMTFLIASTVTVYHDAPEPTDEATLILFMALNEMFDEMPEMASVPNKDKQFLYDTYVCFSGLALAGYMQAKENNDNEMLKQYRTIAGVLLQEVLKLNPDKIIFEGNTLKIER